MTHHTILVELILPMMILLMTTRWQTKKKARCLWITQRIRPTQMDTTRQMLQIEKMLRCGMTSYEVNYHLQRMKILRFLMIVPL